MRRYIFFASFLVLFGVGAGFSQTTAADSNVLPAQTVSKASLAAKHADSKLNETVLHKSVLNYSLPAELAEVAQKCAAGEPDECYFSYKTFENAADSKLAAAANLELSVLSLQRGLVKQALSYINRACELNPDDPFMELTRGWTYLAAGKYKKARKSFDDLMYLTADFEYVSSSKTGNALSWYLSGNKEKSAAEWQYLYTANPYNISFVSYMLGKIAAEMKASRHLAPVFLQQALTHDSKNYAAAK
uniref:tetratricopeptide repeat protein n=1 Tax=Candidatus Avelusimicrobium fimicolum TaxID=3416216 RepID=UPI003D0A0DEC